MYRKEYSTCTNCRIKVKNGQTFGLETWTVNMADELGPCILHVYVVQFHDINPGVIICAMTIFDSNKELKSAAEKSLGHVIPNKLFEGLTHNWNPPYSEQDLAEIVTAAGGTAGISAGKTFPQIVGAIAEELTLWQEIKLRLEPQLRELRQAMFRSPKPLSANKAKAIVEDFLKSETQMVRAAYVHLLIERFITPRDMTRYSQNWNRNKYEFLLATMVLIMNRSYLSGYEALWYFLTGRRLVTVNIFNPTITLVSYRLVKYLQRGGRLHSFFIVPKRDGIVAFGRSPRKVNPPQQIVAGVEYPESKVDLRLVAFILESISAG